MTEHYRNPDQVDSVEAERYSFGESHSEFPPEHASLAKGMSAVEAQMFWSRRTATADVRRERRCVCEPVGKSEALASKDATAGETAPISIHQFTKPVGQPDSAASRLHEVQPFEFQDDHVAVSLGSFKGAGIDCVC